MIKFSEYNFRFILIYIITLLDNYLVIRFDDESLGLIISSISLT